MRGILFLIILLLPFTPLRAEPRMAVYFSPHGGCTEAVIQTIAGAKKSILVEAYSFTSTPIAKALIAAKRRAVRVGVILDKGELANHYSAARLLGRSGVPVAIDSSFRIAHSKVMIVDGTTVITGSFNFTKCAEASNSENLLVISNAPDLARKYTTIWQEHRGLSEPYSEHHSAYRRVHEHKSSPNFFQRFGNFFHSLGI